MATQTHASLPISDHKPAPYKGPSRDEVLALRQQYLTPGLLTFYKDPLLLVEGHMQYLWDEKGKQYLDGFAGIVTVSVGHCHPDIVKKVHEQVGKLQHVTTIYLHPTIGQFGKKLAEHMPEGSDLSVTYFTNSGSEANEIAILSSREFTGNTEVISLRNCYHGGTQATMALTAHSTWKFKTNPTVNVKNALAPYCYRCPYGLEYPSCGLKCAHDVENVIKYETSGQVAAFIAEPIQGVGGAVTPPPEYFKIVYDIVRKAGGLCIADEVQTGFGRTGEHFWGFENFGVTPDMVTMAKGIGNGIPLGACTTRTEIGKMMKNRIHFNTYGGNPISMTQGLATLEVIDKENIQQNAKKVGTPPEKPIEGVARAAQTDRRSARHGPDAGRRAGARPENQRAGQHRSRRRAGTVQRPRPADRQGRPVRQHAAHQTADVHHERRCRLYGRLFGRSAGGDRSKKIVKRRM